MCRPAHCNKTAAPINCYSLTITRGTPTAGDEPLTEFKEKIAQRLWQFARRSPIVFSAGALSGAILVIGCEGFALKNTQGTLEQWGWMPVSERDNLRADLQQARTLADDLKKERDVLAEKNSMLSMQMSERGVEWQRCRQLDEAIRSEEQHLVQLGAKLKHDVIYAAPSSLIAFQASGTEQAKRSDDDEGSRSPEIDQDHFNIANVKASLSSLRDERSQTCNVTSTNHLNSAIETTHGRS